MAQAFGPIPRPTRTIAPTYTLDPPQDGERTVTLRRVGGAPLVYVAYHVPPAASADFAAATLLAQVLGDTPGGRLYKNLVERQLAGQHLRLHPGAGRAEPALHRRGAGADAGRRQGARGDSRDRRFARHRAGHRRGAGAGADAVAERLGQGLRRSREDRRRPLGSDRRGRLAPLLPRPRQRAQGVARRHPPGRRRAAAPRQPHRRHLPADGAAGARAGAGAGRRRGAGQGLQGRSERGAGRVVRPDPGEPRRPHPALRPRQRPQGRAPAQGHARPGGAGAAAPALRRRGDAERPGRGRRLRRRPARQGRRRPDAPADRRPVRPAAGRCRILLPGPGDQRRHHDPARPPAGGDRAGGQAAARAELHRPGARGGPGPVADRRSSGRRRSPTR